MDDNTQIEDADIVETAVQPVANGVANRLNLEALINRYVGDIEKVREQLKAQKEMLEANFQNDPVYAEADEKVKEATRAKTAVKQTISKQAAVAVVADKVKALKEDMKDAQDHLSALVQQYFKETGMNQVTGDDGEIREIVIVTKLVRKKA